MTSTQSTARPAARARARMVSSFIAEVPKTPASPAPPVALNERVRRRRRTIRTAIAGRPVDRATLVAKIAEQAQYRAIGQAPACRDRGCADGYRGDGTRAGKMRRKHRGAQGKQPAVERGPFLAQPSIRRGPARLEGLARIGIGDLVRLLARLEAMEVGELATTAFAHRLGKLAMVVGEIQERRRARLLLAHEDQRD